MNLTGRTALVTGGASGIGAACALELAARGARVVVSDLSAEAAVAVSSRLPNDAIGIRLDITDLGSLQPTLDHITGRVGDVNILVNNAGIFAMQPLLEVTPEHFDQLFAVNTRGMFFMLQTTARTMVSRGTAGTIVNLASQAGRRGEAPSSIYAATKAAVISLTQSAALALIDHGIRVNAVAPGVIDTPMWAHIDHLRTAERQVPAGTYTAEITSTIPARRLGTPAEIAEVVAFLASDHSSYIFGQTLNVDGGNVLS
jgi:NAD(P)-dependent dehydrogenase (short-subunit alcohol dehydrogenase family)